MFLALVFSACALPAALSVQYGVKSGDWTALGEITGARVTLHWIKSIATTSATCKSPGRSRQTITRHAGASKRIHAAHGKGVLYFTAGPRRNVIALDAATGEAIWIYRPDEGVRGDRSPRKNTRGISYWTDGREDRIILVTPGFHLIALDAKTGRPVPGFGKDGIVDLFQELDPDFKGDLVGQLGNTSPAVVSNDTIIVGAALPVGMRTNKENVKADVLAFDARTGKKKWVFHTIPRKGEPGYETWETGADYSGNTAVWTTFTADDELGYVYLPG